MSLGEKIAVIESGVHAAGLSMAEFLRTASVDGSLWHRWKQGETSPNLSTWQRIEEAFASLPKPKQKARRRA